MTDDGFYSGGDTYNLDRITSHHLAVLKSNDKELIRDHINWKMSTKHITSVRARKIAYCLVGWKYYFDKPFQKLTIDDVHMGITKMKEGRSLGGPRKGKPLAPNTQRDMVKVLKPFLRWMIKNKGLKIKREMIDDREEGISPPKGQPTQITSSMILTVDEIMNIIKVARCRRDQALISILYESGCRIGELGRLKWKDAVFDEYGIKLYITDRKENQKRYYRITMSKPALTALKETLPEAPNDDAFIFVDSDGAPMKYKTFEKIFKVAAVRAGVTKHVHLHLLRHTRATHMKSQGFSDSTIKKALWNNESTAQWETYVNLSEEDVDGEFLRMAGMTKEEKKTKIAEGLKPKPCYNCGEDNWSKAAYCYKCGSNLDPDIADKIEYAFKKARQLPEYDALLKRIMEEESLNRKNK